MNFRYFLGSAGVFALGLVAIFSVSPSVLEITPATAQKLQELRNLGKAMYENPGTQAQAVSVLRQAAELAPHSAQDRLNYGLALLRSGQVDEGIREIERARILNPKLPHTYFNLGVEFKKRNEVERALRELTHMVELVPTDPKTHYNLGVLHKLKGNLKQAIISFEHAIQFGPDLAAPHFQLYNTLRRTELSHAKKHLSHFERIKALTQNSAVNEDINWSFYSELYDPQPPHAPTEQATAIQFRAMGDPHELNTTPLGVLLRPTGSKTPPQIMVWSNQSLLLTEPNREAIEILVDSVNHVAAGDSNNDGNSELCLAGATGLRLLSLSADTSPVFGRPYMVAGGNFSSCLWVDYDHDYDLDLMAIGINQVLLRNNGDGTFANVSEAFPFVQGVGLSAIGLELWENNSSNIVAVYKDKIVVYEDLKLGRFRSETLDRSSRGKQSVRMKVVDVNHDGFLDVTITNKISTLVLENVNGRLQTGITLPPIGSWADWQNRGILDAVSNSSVISNLGHFQFELIPTIGLPSNIAFTAASDFNSDGRIDLVVVENSGKIHYLRNKTDTSNAWVNLAFHGVKNNKLLEGARIEVKAGGFYRKDVYAGHPITVGLGSATQIDTIRITWPNGLIQNEPGRSINSIYSFEEKPRLSGSCPMVYSWNGQEFEFISEILGVAPLGAGIGNGQFLTADHDEYLWISGERLKPRDGFYNIRITEELREVAYLDQIKLIAVDHPKHLDIFTSEKFKLPPFPAFQLYEVTDRIYPISAHDKHGHDVLKLVTKRDARYVNKFYRDFTNRAELHSLTLDFPDLQGGYVLFLHGWVDWVDASHIVASSQSKQNQLQMPILEVKDSTGHWRVVDPDIGLPSGSPRTIAVDLTGKFLSESRQVRISSNMAVYWDEIFAAQNKKSPQGKSSVQITKLLPNAATIGFHGFSKVVIHPSRLQPERYVYSSVSPTTLWNPTPGNYTRYGDVRELLAEIDDRFVILGSGDQIDLRFNVESLPVLHSGHRRDFLLMVDGWAKENEANTAYGNSVAPLPFHAMSAYPYGPLENYPDDDHHKAYLREYNRRAALQLIRPLQNNE